LRLNELGPLSSDLPPSPEAQPSRRPWWRRRAAKIIGSLLAAGLIALVVGAEYFLHHLEPIVRTRVVQTLSESFNSPVELDTLHISLFRGIEVNGSGLRIPYGYQPNDDPVRKVGPLLSVQSFRFRTTLGSLLHQTAHVDEVRAEGIEIHVPPHDQRFALFGTREGKLHADPTRPKTRPRIAFTVAHVVSKDVKLFVETDKPGKEALEFDIHILQLNDVGPKQASTFTADLMNAKPKGEISSQGKLGPWVSDDPRETPVEGDFTFSNADMNTIRGLGGTLQGKGHFNGKLDSILVDGSADVPNFSLDTANHPMPLFTRYHAFVDGTTGDTTLAPVQARLGRSDFTTAGKVVKTPNGHDIALDVEIPNAQVADFLRLAVKTAPPLMNGTLRMKAKLHIPPGPERVPAKMGLAGKFEIRSVHFNNSKLQDRIDGLSARAQGHPEEVKSVSNDQRAEAASGMSADFVLEHGLMTATNVNYSVPGALVQLNGVYSMDGNVFEFKGHVRTEATASQMVGGWKGLLLKPVDGFLKKPGAGLQLPVAISGTEGDVHLGLAMHGGAEESPQDMAKDLKQNHGAIADRARLHQQKNKEKAEKKAARDAKKSEKAEKKVEKRAEREKARQEAGPSHL
jgi:hypothetical protein